MRRVVSTSMQRATQIHTTLRVPDAECEAVCLGARCRTKEKRDWRWPLRWIAHLGIIQRQCRHRPARAVIHDYAILIKLSRPGEAPSVEVSVQTSPRRFS